jgi:hypothetical protein
MFYHPPMLTFAINNSGYTRENFEISFLSVLMLEVGGGGGGDG